MPIDLSSQSFPQEWAEKIAALAGRVELPVAGLAVGVEITPETLRQVFFPLLAWLDELSRGKSDPLLAGLAGIPGSGKSTFAAAAAHVADALFPPGRLAVVSLDGWHWPNAVLEQRTTQDEQGRTIPLSRRKGGPQSFDVAAFSRCLRELRTAGRSASLPVYDRRRHEPVPQALLVPAATRIILVEGNYVLGGEAPWDAVAEQLHPKLFLEYSLPAARRRIIARHVRGGLTADQAEQKYAANDCLNTQIVLAAAGRADAVISWN